MRIIVRLIFVYERGYPAVVNHEDETEFLKSVAEKFQAWKLSLKQNRIWAAKISLTILKKYRVHFSLPARRPANPFPHHHPKFDFDENAMLIAAKTLGAAAIDFQDYFQ